MFFIQYAKFDAGCFDGTAMNGIKDDTASVHICPLDM